jgi:hypothetical protein
MKDKIKKCIISGYDFDIINKQELDECWNYITNLQEENERLKEIVENLTTMTASGDRKQIKNTAQFKLDICKQKIDKAIEYTERFTNGKTSRIDTFENVELVLETILQILKGE